MNTIIAWEFNYMWECFLLGVILMIAYDIIKLLRFFVKHSGIVIALEDIIYWITAGVLMFLLLYKQDAGSIRWFAVAMTMLGMVLYHLIIENKVLKIIGNGIKGLLKKLRKKDKINL